MEFALKSWLPDYLINFKGYSQLRDKGILGMNRRNIVYIGKHNPRYLFPLVDDKLKTKRLAIEHNVSVPDLIGVIESQYDARSFSKLVSNAGGSGSFHENLSPEGDVYDESGACDSSNGENGPGFCVKPAKGSGGKGILVITKVKEGKYYRPDGQALPKSEIQRHISNILAGLFSLGGGVDVAMIESLITADDSLAKYSFEGVPDIRVIVFRGIPVMAMMRLSCKESNGKANLHQGAVGVGLDIATGKTLNAVQKDKTIEFHPDTGVNLLDLQVPKWSRLIELACACYEMSGLGYLGVDLVLDKQKGPILLELNARPGLSIQIANSAGLIPRLETIEQLSRPDRMSIADRIAFANENFSTPSP